MEEMIWNEETYVILAENQIGDVSYRMIQKKDIFMSGEQDGFHLVRKTEDGAFEEEKNEEIIQAFLDLQMKNMIADQTITLMAEDGTKVDFVVMGQASIEEKHYLALTPLETQEEPEVVIMEIVGEGEDARLNVIMDPDVINAVRENIMAQMEDVLN